MKVSVICWTNASLKALWTSGLSRRTNATFLSISIFSMVHLHPENPEPGFLLRRIHRRRNSQRQHHPCICRINDAIIPQARCAVIRAAFVCVLVEYRLHEFLLLGG